MTMAEVVVVVEAVMVTEILKLMAMVQLLEVHRVSVDLLPTKMDVDAA